MGDKVLIITHLNNKMDPVYEGPFIVTFLDLENHRVRIKNKRLIRYDSLRNIKPYYSQEGEDVVVQHW